MAALNQPRDWHGRWVGTTGSMAGRSGAVYARSARGRRGRGSVTIGLNSKRARVGYFGRSAARSASRIGTRPGSPIKGNKNVRYVSRTSAVLRGSGALPGSYARGIGRAASARGAHSINRGRLPRHGYIVTYGPRSTPVLQRSA